MRFGREPHLNGVDPALVDSVQAGSDPRTEVPILIGDMWFDATTRGLHPWAMDDGELLKLAFAGAAYVNDFFAETLRQEAAFTDHDRTRLDADVAWFATNLSEAAKEKIRDAEALQLSQLVNGQVFDEDMLERIVAENSLPWWPRTSPSHAEEWQIQSTSEPVVSTRFLKATVEAARLIELDAVETRNVMLGHTTVNGTIGRIQITAPIPPEYIAMGSVITEIHTKGAAQLDKASEALGRSSVGDSLGLVYDDVHGGFIDMMTAYTAALCPPVLGAQFLPTRLAHNF